MTDYGITADDYAAGLRVEIAEAKKAGDKVRVAAAEAELKNVDTVVLSETVNVES